MPLYEHVFLARQEVSNQQVEALMKEFSQVIVEGGGKVGKTEYWGLKSLAYKIKKSRKAHYALMNLEAPAAAVAEMERRMGLSSDVIRFLTLKVEAHETEPSVQMRRGDRDDRRDGDRGGFRGDRGGFRGDRGGFRGDRDRDGPRGDREGGPRGDREGGSTFRARPPGGGPRGPREGDAGDRGPRPPRPPRDQSGSEG
jgi:small subunit ribosomal protein S6